MSKTLTLKEHLEKVAENKKDFHETIRKSLGVKSKRAVSTGSAAEEAKARREAKEKKAEEAKAKREAKKREAETALLGGGKPPKTAKAPATKKKRRKSKKKR